MRWTGMTDQGGLAVLMQVCRTGEAWPWACMARAGWQLNGRLSYTVVGYGHGETLQAVMSEAHGPRLLATEKSRG